MNIHIIVHCLYESLIQFNIYIFFLRCWFEFIYYCEQIAKNYEKEEDTNQYLSCRKSDDSSIIYVCPYVVNFCL